MSDMKAAPKNARDFHPALNGMELVTLWAELFGAKNEIESETDEKGDFVTVNPEAPEWKLFETLTNAFQRQANLMTEDKMAPSTKPEPKPAT